MTIVGDLVDAVEERRSPELSGSLDDLSLDELFNLLTMTGRSGVIGFGDPVGASIWVVNGQLVYGTSPGAPDARDLLLRQGIVTEAAYDGAERATSHKRSITENLVDLFEADPTRIAAVATEQIITTMFEVVVVGADSFEFRSGQVDPLGEAVSLVHTDVLAEADRRRVQWQRIAELIPSTSIVTALSPELPGGRAGMTVTADEWQVLAKLDGYRSVAEVIAELGQSAFEVCGVLYELLRAGTAVVLADRRVFAPGEHR